MFSKNNNSKKAFTLVELIVVIVILAILATIAFLSFSSQSASARDSTRLSDINNIAKGLSVFNATAGSYPKPDSYITLSASGTTIGYQGYAGTSVLNMIKISNGGKDPLDTSTYYTYSANAAQSKFQILGFLEDSGNSALSIGDQTFRLSAFGYQPLAETFADPASYSGRYVITKGDQLGILLQSGSMVPLQAPGAITGTGVDVASNSNAYLSVTSNKIKAIIGSGSLVGVKSCNELLQNLGYLYKQDGIYSINPTGTGTMQVFCDMTTDGGGWTVLGKNKASGGYAHAPGFYDDGNIPSKTNIGSISLFKFPDSIIGNNTAFYWKDTIIGQYVSFKLTKIENIKKSPDNYTQLADDTGLRFITSNITNQSNLYKFCAIGGNQSPENANNFRYATSDSITYPSDWQNYGKYGYAWIASAGESNKRVFNMVNYGGHECSYGTYGLQRYNPAPTYVDNVVFGFR